MMNVSSELYTAVFCVLFILLGGWIVTIGEKTVLQCDRRKQDSLVDCRINATNLVRKRVVTISQLLDVDVNVKGGKHPKYRIILIARGDRIPLTSDYMSGKSIYKAKVEQIRNFLEDPTQTTLTIQEDSRWDNYIGGGIVVVGCTAALICLFINT